MSEVINPPDYYFTGINFNPAFYADDAGLTQATANTLYLRKTVPDTATANETFLADINCEGGIFVFDSIATPNAVLSLESFPDDPTIQLTSGSLGTMTIKSNSVEVEASRTLNIGTNTNVDLNVGTGSRTGLGTGPSPFIVHNYSDGDNCLAGNNVHLNNGANNLSNTAIHNGASSGGVVNIMTGTSSTGIVNIGTTGTTTNVKGNSAIGVAGSGTVTINRPLTIGYTTYPITTNSQIGYFNTPTVTWGTLAFDFLATSPTLPIGNYLINVVISTTGVYVPNFLFFSAGGGASPIVDNRIPFVAGSDRNMCCGAYLLCLTTTGTVSLRNFAGNAQTLQSGTVSIIRLS